MAKDNYVVRKQYTGLAMVDGQLIPQRGDAKPEDLAHVDPTLDAAVRNGRGRGRPARNAGNSEE